MKIFIFLALVAAVSAESLLGIDLFASNDVNATIKIGSSVFEMKINKSGSGHLFFRPSTFTTDMSLTMTIGLVHSNESTQDVKMLLLPGCVQKIVEFGNVSITLMVNYTRTNEIGGLRRAVRIDKNLEAISDSKNEHNKSKSMTDARAIFLMSLFFLYIIAGVVIVIENCTSYQPQFASVPKIRRASAHHVGSSNLPIPSEIEHDKLSSNKLAIDEDSINKNQVITESIV